MAHFNKEITIFGFNPEDIKDLAATLKRNNIPFGLHIPKEAYEEVKPEEKIDALFKAAVEELKTRPPQKYVYRTCLADLLLSVIVVEVTKELIKIISDWLKERRRKGKKTELFVIVKGNILKLNQKNMRILKKILEESK